MICHRGAGKDDHDRSSACHGSLCCDRATAGQTRVEVTISFGGLLLQLRGDPQKLDALELDTNVFLLMKKV